ncbi:enoyl-CoA hydratase/isomerase family protein [Salipiger sp.]|uniref:enoyl-CoA hydratase/isomerase family protein n=1 Tax=Salipiger sp. TaxID=2078585 RepID=UPI003A9696A7
MTPDTADSRPQAYWTREGAVAILTLDNPPMNVVTLALTSALGVALDQIAADDTIRAVIVTGAGTRAFCAGSDISEFPDMMKPGQVIDKKLARQNRIFNQLASFPKPTVAAVTGLAYGGGVEIACCCDLIVADEGARFCLPEIKLGVFPSSGGTWRTTRRIGMGRAKEMMFLAGPIDAATALAWGLATRVAPAGEALATARTLAEQLAQRPMAAFARCKEMIMSSYDAPDDLLLARSLRHSDAAFSSAEAAEGVRAFFAKQSPDFTKI